MGRRLCIFGFCRSIEMLSDVVEDTVLEHGGEVCHRSTCLRVRVCVVYNLVNFIFSLVSVDIVQCNPCFGLWPLPQLCFRLCRRDSRDVLVS